MPSTPRAIRPTLATFLAVLLAMLASQAHLQFADTDLWGRLAAAARWFGTGVFPRTDPFSFVAQGREWVDHEWLSSVVFYGVLRAGGEWALLALKDALLAGCLGLVFLVHRRVYAISSVPAFLGLLIASPMIDLAFMPVVRCQVFSFLFFLVFLFALEKERVQPSSRFALVALVPLGIIWANLHGGFAIGLLLLLAYGFGDAVVRRSVRAAGAPLLIAAAILFGAVIVNPYGPRYLGFLAMAWTLNRSDILEWQPLWSRFSGERVEIALFVVASLVLGTYALLAAFRDRRGPASPAVLMLGLAAMTAHSYRFKTFLAFGGVALAPVLVPPLPTPWFRVSGYLDRWIDRLALMVAVSSALVLISPGSHPLTAPLPSEIYPTEEIAYLRTSGVTGNLVTPFSKGEFAAWALFPNIKVSMDGRFEEVYRLEEMRAWTDFYKRDLTGWARDHGASWALVPASAKETARALRDSGKWRLVMARDRYGLYTADQTNAAPSAPEVSDHVPTIADYFAPEDLARLAR